MGHWFFRLPIPVQLDVRVNMLDLIFIENALPPLDLRIDREQCPRGLVSAKVSDHAGQMGKSDKALRHTATFVVNQDKCHLMGMII